MRKGPESIGYQPLPGGASSSGGGREPSPLDRQRSASVNLGQLQRRHVSPLAGRGVSPLVATADPQRSADLKPRPGAGAARKPGKAVAPGQARAEGWPAAARVGAALPRAAFAAEPLQPLTQCALALPPQCSLACRGVTASASSPFQMSWRRRRKRPPSSRRARRDCAQPWELPGGAPGPGHVRQSELFRSLPSLPRAAAEAAEALPPLPAPSICRTWRRPAPACAAASASTA